MWVKGFIPNLCEYFATFVSTQDLSDIADSLNSLSSQLECVAALNNPVNGGGVGGALPGQPQVLQAGPGGGGKAPRGQQQQSSKEGGSVSRKPSNVSDYRRPSLAADKVGCRIIKTLPAAAIC